MRRNVNHGGPVLFSGSSLPEVRAYAEQYAHTHARVVSLLRYRVLSGAHHYAVVPGVITPSTYGELFNSYHPFSRHWSEPL